MSIKWMSIVWKFDGLYQSEKFVLLALADNANNEGQCWPSIPDIAERCCLQPRQTINIINQLTEKGYLSREMRSGKSTVYTLQTPALDCSTTPATQCTPANIAPLQNPTPTPALDCSTTPAKSDITYKEEPSFEPSIEEPSLRKDKKPKKNIYEKEFETFWKIYPANGASKFEAAKSYEKSLTKETTHADIERGARAYADHISRTGVEVAHATTWLNNQRWTVNYSGIKPAGKSGFQPATKQTWGSAAEQLIAEDRARNAAGGGAVYTLSEPSLRDAETVRESPG